MITVSQQNKKEIGQEDQKTGDKEIAVLEMIEKIIEASKGSSAIIVNVIKKEVSNDKETEVFNSEIYGVSTSELDMVLAISSLFDKVGNKPKLLQELAIAAILGGHKD